MLQTADVASPSPRRSRAIDPQTRPLRWSGKAHSREARVYREFRRELVKHVGGRPNAAQRVLIDRLAWLQTHLAGMDERALREGGLSEHAQRQYLAWSASVVRSLRTLGFSAAPEPRPTLAEILREHSATAAPPPVRAPSTAPSASAVAVEPPAPQPAQRAPEGA
jgi:hypothetical protein